MPWLPFYCTQRDVPSLLSMMSDDFAFIVPDGKGRWRAVREHVPHDRSRTALWHIPSGPLPLMGNEFLKPGGIVDVKPTTDIEDPWAGWTERRAGADPSIPFFGSVHGGVLWLNLRLEGRDPGSSVGLSSLEWVGDRYPYGARKVTVNRWAKLRRQMAKLAQKVPRGGPGADAVPEIWAFPDALNGLGIADMNP